MGLSEVDDADAEVFVSVGAAVVAVVEHSGTEGAMEEVDDTDDVVLVVVVVVVVRGVVVVVPPQLLLK